MLNEFKEFIARGNVIDLAVGVIIGGAFGKIVTSLTDDVLMPPVGMALGRIDFSNLYLSLNGQPYPSLEAARAAGAPVVAWGLFVGSLVNFLIVAFCIFLLVKAINRFHRKREEAPEVPAPAVRECPECLGSVPVKARRCAHCTSALEPVA